MNLETQFPYILDNLSSHPGFIFAIVGCFIGSLLCILLRLSMIYTLGFFIIRTEQKNLERKKHILGDLILMKDIQTEMEKEIEQAMLKATFQQ